MHMVMTVGAFYAVSAPLDYHPFALYSTLYCTRFAHTAVEYNLVPHSDVKWDKWDSTYFIITLNTLPHAGIQGGNVAPIAGKVVVVESGSSLPSFLLLYIYLYYILYYTQLLQYS
jgi:hypothetical protein